MLACFLSCFYVFAVFLPCEYFSGASISVAWVPQVGCCKKALGVTSGIRASQVRRGSSVDSRASVADWRRSCVDLGSAFGLFVGSCVDLITTFG